MKKPSIIAVDIGNSAIKINIAHDVVRFAHDELLQANALLKQNADEVIAYSTVDTSLITKLFAGIEKSRLLDIRTNITHHQSPLKKVLSSGTGTDRLLGAIGAMTLTSAPLITIDCGTAITVNAVNSRAQFEGGAIMPGLHTQLRSLHEYTHALPLVEPGSSIKLPARDTEAAIRSGVIRSIVVAIQQMVKDICRSMNESTEIPVFLTGGDAMLIKKFLSKDMKVKVEANLVLQGIRCLATKALCERNLQ